MRVALCSGTAHDQVRKLHMMNLLQLCNNTTAEVLPLYSEARDKTSLLNDYARQAVELDCDWALFVDADVEVPPDAVDKLTSGDSPIMSGLVHLRHYPFTPIAGWRGPAGRMINHRGNDWLSEYCELGDGVVLVGWVGMGCLAVKDSAFRHILNPFTPVDNKGHDISFCERANTLGFSIRVDTGIKCNHWTHMPISEEYAKSFHKSGMSGLYRHSLQESTPSYGTHSEMSHYLRADDLLYQDLKKVTNG